MRLFVVALAASAKRKKKGNNNNEKKINKVNKFVVFSGIIITSLNIITGRQTISGNKRHKADNNDASDCLLMPVRCLSLLFTLPGQAARSVCVFVCASVCVSLLLFYILCSFFWPAIVSCLSCSALRN